MKKLIYQIEFFTYWHIGTGLTSGVGSDAIVMRNEEGFPFIPGKTIKGLVREAAEKLKDLSENNISDNFIKEVFGSKRQEKYEEKTKEHENKIIRAQATCFFSNAEISLNLSKSIAGTQKKLLYSNVASTAIDEKGQALEHSLRKMEVTIPLFLYGAIENFDLSNTQYKNEIELCFTWIKRLGLNRSRGLGRCKFTTFEN